MATRISQETTRRRVKKVIAGNKQNLEWADVLAVYTLRGRRSAMPRGLGFTDHGLRVLQIDLNSAFSDVGVSLTWKEIGDAKKVRDLWRAIWKKIPANRRR
ncbi:MAG: hypothetical protein ACYS0G_03770 [Planctomycetota bacterium]|jgi:hypothetical protein